MASVAALIRYADAKTELELDFKDDGSLTGPPSERIALALNACVEQLPPAVCRPTSLETLKLVEVPASTAHEANIYTWGGGMWDGGIGGANNVPTRLN